MSINYWMWCLGPIVAIGLIIYSIGLLGLLLGPKDPIPQKPRLIVRRETLK